MELNRLVFICSMKIILMLCIPFLFKMPIFFTIISIIILMFINGFVPFMSSKLRFTDKKVAEKKAKILMTIFDQASIAMVVIIMVCFIH